MPRKKQEPVIKKERKMGKYTGYEVEGNKYFLAPTWTEQFQRLSEEHRAINALITSVNEYALRQFTAIEKTKHDMWVRVSEDIGVDFIKVGASYDYVDRAIILSPPDPPEAKEELQEAHGAG